ncbi:MAG: alpha/beta hydrolase-fold protein, partial [Actinomycetes bacterium]
MKMEAMGSMWAITGGGVVVALVLAWVLVTGGLIFLWKRLAVTRVWAVAARLAGIVVSNLLVVVLAFVLLNNQYEFYTSWSELRDDLTSGGFFAADEAKAVPVDEVLKTGADAATTLATGRVISPLPPVVGVPEGTRAGRDQTYTVVGKRSRVTTSVSVVLPPGYRDNAAVYPVLVAIHGLPGTPETMLRELSIGEAVDAEVAAGKLAQPILVVPKTTTATSRDSECTDVPGTNMETFLAVDLPNWVQKSFRVTADRSAWASMGLSEGGYCSAMLATLHPQRFGSAMAFGGYFRPIWPGGGNGPYPPTDLRSKRYDLVRMAQRRPPPSAIWAQSPKTDALSYDSTMEFFNAVKPPTAMEAVILAYGGHRASVWRPFVPVALSWLGQVAPGFRPSSPPPPTLPRWALLGPPAPTPAPAPAA